jgi:cell wall-associated NlpC family hydrolase
MKPVAMLSLLFQLLVPAAQASSPAEDIPVYAISLVGSRYRLGGTSPESGSDCSGFVGHVFRRISGVILPRDSQAMSEALQPLEPAALEPGDLVFFNTPKHSFSHVGIYLCEDRFVHATSSHTGSVMVSRLSDRYWHEHFDGARRVEPSSHAQLSDAAHE